MASRIVEANIKLHTRLAGTYEQDEPQFRPENQARVRSVLETLRQRLSGGRLLDLGCGTGFIIRLASGLFDDIHGVDVTQAMLDRVDPNSGGVRLHLSPAESLPYPDDSFDMVTAYSFLHHTQDYRLVLQEAVRVLRPGGLMYIDQEPNRLFWTSIIELKPDEAAPLSALVARARDAVLETDVKMEREYGIDRETFRLAEFGKAVLGGIDPHEFLREARLSGFSQCVVRREWFLGQADLMREESNEAAEKMADFLRRMSPLSDRLFKYLQFVLVKAESTSL